jgi:hypothetical protein
MHRLVRGVFCKPAKPVTNPREHEEQHERQAKRVFIEAQDPAATPDRPGRLGNG